LDDDAASEDAPLAVLVPAILPDQAMAIIADVAMIDGVIVSIPVICSRKRGAAIDNEPVSLLLRGRKRGRGEEGKVPVKKRIVKG
jgi:hypothetical protein